MLLPAFGWSPGVGDTENWRAAPTIASCAPSRPSVQVTRAVKTISGTSYRTSVPHRHSRGPYADEIAIVVHVPTVVPGACGERWRRSSREQHR